AREVRAPLRASRGGCRLLRRGGDARWQSGRLVPRLRRPGPSPAHVPHRGGAGGRVHRAGRRPAAEAAQPGGAAPGPRHHRRTGPARPAPSWRDVAPAAPALYRRTVIAEGPPVLVGAAELRDGVRRLAAELSAAYDDGIVLVAPLKGSVPFLADLVRF